MYWYLKSEGLFCLFVLLTSMNIFSFLSTVLTSCKLPHHTQLPPKCENYARQKRQMRCGSQSHHCAAPESSSDPRQLHSSWSVSLSNFRLRYSLGSADSTPRNPRLCLWEQWQKAGTSHVALEVADVFNPLPISFPSSLTM